RSAPFRQTFRSSGTTPVPVGADARIGCDDILGGIPAHRWVPLRKVLTSLRQEPPVPRLGRRPGRAAARDGAPAPTPRPPLGTRRGSAPARRPSRRPRRFPSRQLRSPPCVPGPPRITDTRSKESPVQPTQSAKAVPSPWWVAFVCGMASYIDAAAIVSSGTALVLYQHSI